MSVPFHSGKITNNLFLIRSNVGQYKENLRNIIKSISKKGKTCYVCINRKYIDVVNELKNININIKKFTFIDILSSHYTPHIHRKNCKFLSSPELTILKNEIVKTTKHSYKNILFDSFSKLLTYHDKLSLLKFTNELIYETENVTKFFFMSKENGFLSKEIETLTKDIEMFADNTIPLKENNK